MNANVITKIEYQLPGENAFTVIDFVPESAKLTQDSKNGSGGPYFETKLEFKVAGIDSIKDSNLKGLDNRRALLKCTDSSGLVFIIGSTNSMPRISVNTDHGPMPSNFHGYQINAGLNSKAGYTVQ